jgi:hypothetical protein
VCHDRHTFTVVVRSNAAGLSIGRSAFWAYRYTRCHEGVLCEVVGDIGPVGQQTRKACGLGEVVAVEALEPIIDVITWLDHEPSSRLDRFDHASHTSSDLTNHEMVPPNPAVRRIARRV